MYAPRIMIIGAGTGGLCLAHGLRAAGVDVRVFERDAHVLIGADGASSRVRRQLLPHAERIDTGLVTVTGKFALDAAARHDTPRAVFKGPTLILGPRGGFMFAGAVEYPPERPSAYDRSEYVMWGFSTHRETLRITDPAAVSADSAREAVLVQTRDWSPAIRRLVERAEAPSLSSFAVRSSTPIEPWQTSRVTLLGDALHNMTPYRGIGANTALRDAAALRTALSDVAGGRRELLPALAAYEHEMIHYGFAAVRASLQQMRRLHARSRIARVATRMMFRLADSLPALRRRMMNQRTD
jgi:2-polyprenyl-6-methoxyphenol hydroxylase-like FAD-dependent oxidoreductase